MSNKKNKTDKNNTQVNTGISAATLVINLSGVETLISEEKQIYPLSQFLSDLGGTAGLIFGLNVLVTVKGFFNYSGLIATGISSKLKRYLNQHKQN